MLRAAGGRRGVTRAAFTLLAIAIALVHMLAPASAYWSSTGTGTGSTTTGTLSSPVSVTVPSNAISNVDLSWTAGSGGVVPQGYYVTRHAAGGDSPGCASSPTALVTGLSCTDTGVADGTYTYVVTAVFRTWTAASASSDSVSVVNPAAVVFTTQPSDVTAGEGITPSVTVALRTAGGAAIAVSGVSVTLAIGTNPASGTLSGTLTRSTAADGTVSFPGLSVDQAGSGYTLVATSTGLTGATSAGFSVIPQLLRTAGTYSVLGTAVTGDALTYVSGDVGVYPGIVATGLGSTNVGGDIHAGDSAAHEAQDDLLAAYNQLNALPVPLGNDLPGDLIGVTLTPGVYAGPAAVALTGVLTLDGGGNPDALFVLKVGAAFGPDAAASMVLQNGAKASNVFWVVGGATDAGGGSRLSGTILSQGAITLGAGAVLIGRALSRGAVTLAGNTIQFAAGARPTMTITPQASDARDATPTISGTTTAPTGSPVTVTVGGQTLTTSVTSGLTWAVTATTLDAGVYPVVAKVRNPQSGDGNTATQSLTVEVNPAPVTLGVASVFSVLAKTAVANTGITYLSADLGVSPAGTVSGFGSGAGTLGGTIHANDGPAGAAQTALATAIANGSGRVKHTEFAGELAGKTFHVGVHHSTAAMSLTGTVTLDGQGDPDAVFIFQTDGAFNTADPSAVVLTGQARAQNVFWVVAGAAGTAAGTQMVGTILATGAITLGAGTILEGRALSRDGAVTMTANTLTGVSP